MRLSQLECVLSALLVLSTSAGADEGMKAPFPFQEAPPKKDWEWDEDERFDELMEQLAINEASLDAVQAALTKKSRRKTSQSAAAARFDENNQMMDRKGGGAMKWDEFYGTNAEKFFYHPIDPNTTYHTDTALRQAGKYEDDKSEADIPARQSLPVHQRPPQWDYIYRANRTARENAVADAALLEGEVEQLEQRRTQLEQEQAVLWCKLAFRAIQRLNMARKPMLRFELVTTTENNAAMDRVKALAAVARFLATSLAVVEKAEQEQRVAFGGVANVVTHARETFEDALLESPSLESEWQATQSELGKFFKLSQMLADKAKTLTESYAGAMDGDLNRETSRKERFRGMLQDSVIDYAQILLALNELTDTMKTEWKVRVDTKRKASPVALTWGGGLVAPGQQEHPSHSSLAQSVAGTKDRDELAGGATLKIDQKRLRKAFGAAKVDYDEKTGVLTLAYDFSRKEQSKDWEMPAMPLGKPSQFRGIRVPAADMLRHRGVFTEGTSSVRLTHGLPVRTPCPARAYAR